MLTQLEPEADPLPPFVTLSQKLAEIFQLTSDRLKLISDSISSSIDAQTRAIQLDAAAAASSRNLKHLPSPSNHPIAKVSDERANRAARPSPQPQTTGPSAPTAIIPKKRPNSNFLSAAPDSHEPFCSDIDHASSTSEIDGRPVDLNLKSHKSSPAALSHSNTLDGISDFIGSEKVDAIGKKNTPLPDQNAKRNQAIGDRVATNHHTTSPNLNSTTNQDVDHSTSKRLIERIAPAFPTGNGADSEAAPPITRNDSSSSHLTSMELCHSSDRLPLPNQDSTSPSPSSSSRRRSTSRPTSHYESDRARSRSVQDPKRRPTMTASPPNSYDSRRSPRLQRSHPHRSSRGVYESYHPEPQYATFYPLPRYAAYYPPRSATFRSRSRSPSASYSRRRGSRTLINQSSAPIEDRRERDEGPRRRYDDPTERDDDRRGREEDRRKRYDDPRERDDDRRGRNEDRRGRDEDRRGSAEDKRWCVEDRRERDEDQIERRPSQAEAQDEREREEDRAGRYLDLYLKNTAERPSYMRLIGILRSLQGSDRYRSNVLSRELLKEFQRLTEKTQTREERMFAHLCTDPRLMHRYLTMAMQRQIITYWPDVERLAESTIKLDVKFRNLGHPTYRK